MGFDIQITLIPWIDHGVIFSSNTWTNSLCICVRCFIWLNLLRGILFRFTGFPSSGIMKITLSCRCPVYWISSAAARDGVPVARLLLEIEESCSQARIFNLARSSPWRFALSWCATSGERIDFKSDRCIWAKVPGLCPAKRNRLKHSLLVHVCPCGLKSKGCSGLRQKDKRKN